MKPNEQNKQEKPVDELSPYRISDLSLILNEVGYSLIVSYRSDNTTSYGVRRLKDHAIVVDCFSEERVRFFAINLILNHIRQQKSLLKVAKANLKGLIDTMVY